jgi:hypothetical protein
MKIKHFLNGKIEYVDVSNFTNIVEAIQAVKWDYVADTGKEPIGIIMGPRDYVSLTYELHNTDRYKDGEYGITYPSLVMGLPIRLKEFNGIELEIELSDFYRYI